MDVFSAGDSEKELLTQLQQGDHLAFEQLYSSHYAKVYSLILKYVHSPELSQDFTQEVFMKIWEKRQHLSHVESFKAYLLVTARNYTINMLKKIAATEAAQSEVLANYPQQKNIVEDDLVTEEYILFLENVLNGLPERTRKIFRMCRDEGKSYEEAAAALGISGNAVKNHMVSSMKALRQMAEKDLGIPLNILLLVFFQYSINQS